MGDLTWTLEFKLEYVEGEMTMVAWKGEAWESNWRGNSKDYSSRSTFEKVTYELIVHKHKQQDIETQKWTIEDVEISDGTKLTKYKVMNWTIVDPKCI